MDLSPHLHYPELRSSYTYVHPPTPTDPRKESINRPSFRLSRLSERVGTDSPRSCGGDGVVAMIAVSVLFSWGLRLSLFFGENASTYYRFCVPGSSLNYSDSFIRHHRSRVATEAQIYRSSGRNYKFVEYIPPVTSHLGNFSLLMEIIYLYPILFYSLSLLMAFM